MDSWVYKVPRAAMMALLALAIAVGCSDGGGGGGGGIPEEELLDPKTTPLTDDDIRHFVSRTQFASSETEIQAVRAAGLPSYIDQMLVFQIGTAVDTAAFSPPIIADPRFPNRTELVRAWFYLMVHGPNAFQEVMALFWHDHFGVSQDVLSNEERWWMLNHITRLRSPGAVGNLRSFISNVSIDWTMLDFLDGIRSTGSRPNENFARELWELFTLGRDNGYTQGDIEEAARALTGYQAVLMPPPNPGQREIVFNAARHDDTDKVIFGQVLQGRSGSTGYLEYNDLVNLTFDQRPVAEFISKKIFEHFVYVDPSSRLVDEMAGILRSNNDDLSVLLRTLFQSRAFFSARAKEGLVKSPVEFAVGFMRSTGLVQMPLTGGQSLDEYLRNMGMRPTQPPSVDGWPTGPLWLSSSSMVERANLVRRAITIRDATTDAVIDALLPPPGERSSAEVVDAFARAARVNLAAAERDEYIRYLDTNRDPSGAVYTDPFDGANPVHVDERVRGLLYILAQHPFYHLR